MELQKGFPSFSQSKYSQGVALKALTDALPNMVWVADRTGRVIYVNQKFQNYTGFTLSELQRRGLKPILHPDDVQKTNEAWDRCVFTGECYSIEYRWKKHDGQYRWQLGMALPFLDDQGQVERWFGTVTDIHEQKMSVEQLKNVEQLHSLLLNSGELATWQWSLKSEKLQLAGKLKDAFGFSSGQSQIELNDLFNHIEKDDRALVLQNIQQVAELRLARKFSFRLRYELGSCCWVRCYVQPELDGNGRLIGLKGFVSKSDRQLEVFEAEKKVVSLAEAPLRWKRSYHQSMIKNRH